MTRQDLKTEKVKGSWNKDTGTYDYYDYVDVPEVFNTLNECFGMKWDLDITDLRIDVVDNSEVVGYGNDKKPIYEEVKRGMWTAQVVITFKIDGETHYRKGAGSAIICKKGMGSDDAVKTAVTEAVKIACGKHMNIGLYLWSRDWHRNNKQGNNGNGGYSKQPTSPNEPPIKASSLAEKQRLAQEKKQQALQKTA